MSVGYGPHAEAFANALVKAFNNPHKLAQFASFRLNVNIHEIASGNLRDWVFELMQHIQSEDREREFVQAALEASENKTLDAVGKNVMRHIDTVAPVPWYQPPDPFETCFVGTDRSFVDRAELRGHLRDLVSPDGTRSLIVSGTTGTGRSYSRALIRFLSEQFGHFKVYEVDLEDFDPDFGPADLARAIVFFLGRGDRLESMPPSRPQSASWTLELREWLTAEIEATKSTWWLVIDGVDAPTVDDKTRQFLLHLVRAADRSAFLRVVLLGWADALPGKLEEATRREKIAKIERETLEDFFNQFATHQGISANRATVDAAVNTVLELAPETAPDRLRKLGRAVGDAAIELAAR